MPIHNSDVARIFNQVADLLDIEGANRFRVRAYRDAAGTISRLSRSVADMVDAGEDLSELPDIGEDLATKIEEIVTTGTLEQLAEIEQRTPPELADLLDIEGLGPKRVRKLHEELGIVTMEQLEQAARAGDIRQVEGFGETLEQDILNDIERAKGKEQRTLLKVAEEVAQPLVSYLREHEQVERVEVAGSYRRRKETVGDLDILVISDAGTAIADHFVDYEDVDEIVSRGETRSTVLLRSGMQVDVRVIRNESYGAALLYFTGSKAHNIQLRNIALDQGLKINEYGVYDDDEQIAGATEEEMYATFELPYIVPELRENRGEIEAARAGELPALVTIDEIRGDLQSHTEASDGRGSLEEMAHAAQERGYDYLAITDHSEHVGVTQGLDADRLAAQLDAIDELNAGFEDFRLLKSCEVDILDDGTLALPDEILQRLDLTVCSIHTNLGLSEEKQTERVVQAMDNPYFSIFAHPTGRRIGQRRPYDIDLERVMEVAAERGCFLEVNAQPDRLDLNDVHAKMAMEMGVKLAISTDAHEPNDLDNMRYGIGQARRGWLTAGDVLNTRGWTELKHLLQR